MTILHVAKSSILSGMENVAISIIGAMPDDVRCVYLTATGSIETKLLEQDIEYIGVEKVDEKAIKGVIDEVKPKAFSTIGMMRKANERMTQLMRK